MKRIEELVEIMTVEEKASLCSGDKFWSTQSLPQYDIPAMSLADGPHGVRKQTEAEDHLGLNKSVKTTCFPTAAGLASSWNRELVYQVGEALGRECQAEGVQVILGPGANIKRSPLCGRNFEYYSEDPYLSTQLALNHINGVQSQGVGTSIKHFAVNNQETRRFNINVKIDERSLHEIYLASFEEAIISGKPWTVMCAYNKINGEFCSQNRKLLSGILKDKWGYKGVVVSDWFAVSERDKALAAGLDLEMPTSAGLGKEKIIEAVKSERLSMEVLNESVRRMLRLIQKTSDGKIKNAEYDKDAHHSLARLVSAESMVLLRNEDEILPLNNKAKIAVVGPFAKVPRYQGTGSSKIVPTKLDIPLDEINKKAEFITYAKGFSVENEDIDERLVDEAVIKVKEAESCVVFLGLPDNKDSEGADRKDIKLPNNQNSLMDELVKVNDNIVVVLCNGSALEMPWLGEVRGIVEAYLGGQAMGGAIADLLFGDINPSGKLAETFPASITQTPSYINFPGDSQNVEYREGIFIGYRYYDKVGVKPLYPFGHGLSYTEFEYSDLKLDSDSMTDEEVLRVSLSVKNIGKRRGKETIQLYVRDIVCDEIRPEKELKGFEKVELEPGEAKTVTFELSKRAFAYYNAQISDWYVPSGKYSIMIGKSSANIILQKEINVIATRELPKNYSIDSTIADIRYEPAAAKLVGMVIEKMTGGGAAGGVGMELDSLLNSIKVQSLVPMTQGMVTIEQIELMLNEMNKK